MVSLSRGARRKGPALPRLSELVDLADGVAQGLERAAQQARDVHLRDPELRRDLRLRQPLLEAEVQDPARAGVEGLQAGAEHDARVGAGEAALLDRHVEPSLAALVVARRQEGRRAG